MLRHPCILGDPQTKGDKIRSGYLTLAFLGAQKRAETLHHPCILWDPQTKGDKIRIGCLSHAFSGAQKWAEMLHHPCILGDPQTKGAKSKVTTYAGGNNNAPSISKYGSLVRADTQIAALR